MSQSFPMPMADFLRLAIGGKYVADRERIYHDFWRHQVRAYTLKTQHPKWNKQGLDAHVEATVEKNLAYLSKNGFDQSTFESEVRAVREWLPGYQKERLSRRASVGGKAHSAKISRNKTLTRLNSDNSAV